MMLSANRFLLLLAAFVFLTGCHSSRPPKTSAALFSLPSLGQAALLESRRNYLEALKQYRDLQDRAQTSEALHLALLGQSRCLAAMNNFPLALAVLLPIESEPSNVLAAERAVAAGIIMLRMKRFRQAENVLYAVVGTIADPVSPDVALWLAPAYVSLAIACRQNGNREGSAMALNRAATLFELRQNRSAAETCRLLVRTLNPNSQPASAVGAGITGTP